MEKKAKTYAYETHPVGCIGPDCGNACTNKFCNKDINNAYLAGAQHMKEKAIEAYKTTCSFSPIGCCQIKKDAGKCDCEELRDFIEELTK